MLSRSVVTNSFQPVDYTVHRILQARILEWVAILSSRRSSQPRDRTRVFHIAGSLLVSYQGSPQDTEEQVKYTTRKQATFSIGQITRFLKQITVVKKKRGNQKEGVVGRGKQRLKGPDILP